MSRQKIIHVINDLGLGGAEMLLINTIRLLPDYDHILVTLVAGGFFEAVPGNISARYSLDYNSKKDFYSAYTRLKKLIRLHRPGLVHAHLQLSGLITKLACPRNIPFFYTLHSPYSVDAFSQNRLSLLAERLTARRYHHMIGVSRQVLNDYLSFVPNCGSADVLHNFVNAEYFDAYVPHAYTPGTPLRCLSIGNLKRAKNYMFTLENFRLIRDLPITLDIYGAGEDETPMRTFIESNDLQHLRMLGRVGNLNEVMAHYDLFIINSSYEGFGIAPLEAMAAGLPVLASDIPVFKDLMNDAAQYISITEEGSLAARLTDIYNGVTEISSYSEKGRKQAEEIASSKNYSKNLISLYKKYAFLNKP